MTQKSNRPFESPESRLLCWLKEHQVETSSGVIAKFSQKELATEYGASVSTVNALLQLLAKTQCVELVRSGRYRVTKTGDQVIQKIDEIKEIIGGDNHAD